MTIYKKDLQALNKDIKVLGRKMEKLLKDFDNEKDKVDITTEDLQKLQNTIDYMMEAVRDIVGTAASVKVRMKYKHECKRIHQLASELIAEIRVRDDKVG